MAWGAVAGAAIGFVGSQMAADAQGDAAESAANTSAGASRYSADVQKKMYDQTRKDQEPWRDAGGAALNKLSLLLGLNTPGISNLSPDQKAQFDPLQAEYDRLDAIINGPTKPDWSSPGGATPLPAITLYEQQRDSIKRKMDAIRSEAEKNQAANPTSLPEGFGSLLKDFSMEDYQADPGYAFRQSEGEKALERSAAARGGLYSGRALKDMARFSQGLASDEYQNAFNRFNTNKSNQFNRLASLAGVGQTANNVLAQAGQNYATGVGNAAMTAAGNAGTAQLVGGMGRASAYQGLGNALGRINWGGVFGNSGSGNYYNSANDGVGGLSAQYIQGGF